MNQAPDHTVERRNSTHLPRDTPTRSPVLLALALAASAVLLVFLLTAPWSLEGRSIGRLTAALAPLGTVALFSLLLPRWRRFLLNLPDIRITAPRLAAILLAGTFLFTIRVVLSQYRSLNVNAWDFSASDLPIRHSLTDGFLYSTFDHRCYLGTHASYLLAAFIPLYAVALTPYWLLATQALAIAAAAATGFLVFHHVLDDRIAAGMLSAAYLLNTYTAKTAQYVFHVEALYPFAVFLLVLGLQKARPGVTVLAAVLLFSIKEDSVLASSGVALALMLARPARPRAAAWLFAAGLVLYLVSSQIVMPAASGSRPGEAWYSSSWTAYGSTPLAAAGGMALHPVAVLRDLWRSGVRDLLEPFLFVPLLGGAWMLAALPVLLVYGAADHGLGAISHFSLYYSALVLPLLFVATAYGIRRIARIPVGSERTVLPSRARVRLPALAILIACAMDGAGYVLRAPEPSRLDVPGLVRAARPDLPLHVQGSLFPRAGYAPNLQPLTRPAVEDDGSFLFKPDSDPYPLTRQELEAFISRLRRDPTYESILSPHGLILVRKRVSR